VVLLKGPKLLIETLTNSSTRHFNHIFLTGPDHIEFNETVEPLVQEETFFIVSSKSFSTDETLQSLELAKNWILQNCKFNDHFIAITSQPNKAKELGFNNMITFPNEIGGRYSIWSPIALPAILELGKGFIEFLKVEERQITNFYMITSTKILLKLFHSVIFGTAISCIERQESY
jgi:glucose-6-phosphate isomerase